MKGFRTLLFNLVLAVVAVTGHAVAPDTAAHVVDVVMLAGSIGGNMILRFITTTPIGKAVVDTAVREVQLHPDALASLGDIIGTTVQNALQAALPTVATATPVVPPPDTDLVALFGNLSKAMQTVRQVEATMAANLIAAQGQVAAALPAGVQTDLQPGADASADQAAGPVPTPVAGGANA